METTIRKGKVYVMLLALGCAGGTIFVLPYIRFVFYNLQLTATGMNHTQSALLMTCLSTVLLFLGIPFGVVADKLPLKKALISVLLLITALALIYSFSYKNYFCALAIWCLIPFATGIYWPVFTKILNNMAIKTGGDSGFYYGIYYLSNGLSAAMANAVSLRASTLSSNPETAFRFAIWCIAASTFVTAIINFICIDSELVSDSDTAKINETAAESKLSAKEAFALILKNPYIWFLIIFTISALSLYSLQSYFNPYLTAVHGVAQETASVFAIFRSYVFLVLGPVSGLIADKVFKSISGWLSCAYLILAVLMAGVLIMPAGINPMVMGCYTLLPSMFIMMTHSLKNGLIGEVSLPPAVIGTAIQCVSTPCAIVDIAITPMFARALDTKGVVAYNYIFIYLICALIVGSACAFFVARNTKKVRALAKSA